MTDALSELLDDDEETPEPERKQSNADNAAQRKLQKAEKELEELRAFKAEREQADRGSAVSQAFQAIGLNPRHAKFFPTEGEVTEDAVKAWAVTEEFLQAGEDEVAEKPTAGFVPTVVSESQSLGAKVYDMDEFLELAKQDPNKATALWNSGRVKDKSGRKVHNG